MKDTTNIVIPEISKYNVVVAELVSSFISGTILGVRSSTTSMRFIGLSLTGNGPVSTCVVISFSGDTITEYNQYSSWGQGATGIRNIRGIA